MGHPVPFLSENLCVNVYKNVAVSIHVNEAAEDKQSSRLIWDQEILLSFQGIP